MKYSLLTCSVLAAIPTFALAAAVQQGPTIVFEDAVSITRIEGMKTSFKPGEPVTITVTAKERNGNVASSAQGWNIQFMTYFAPVKFPRVNLDAVPLYEHSGDNGEYANGKWTLTYAAPAEPGNYYIGITVYCSAGNSACEKAGAMNGVIGQHSRDIAFTVGKTTSTAKTMSFEVPNFKTTCADTDGGKNLRRKGTMTVSGNPQTEGVVFTDRCENNMLTEYVCSASKGTSVTVQCPLGCLAGACKSITEKRPPKIVKAWATVDPYNTDATALTAQLWFDVRKADGSTPTSQEIDDGLLTFFWAEDAYPNLPPSNLGWRMGDDGRAYFSISIGKLRSDFPTTARYTVEAKQGNATARKQAELTFSKNGTVNARLK